MQEKGVVARLEQGGMVVDAVAAVEQLRVATPAGEVLVSGARVELNVTSPGGRTGLVAFVHVEQGSAVLQSAGREVVLAGDERGVLAPGRPPTNVSFIIPATRAVTRAPTDDPVMVPVAAAVPVVVPVAVPVAQPAVDLVPGGEIRGEVELLGPLPPAAGGTGACSGGDAPWAGERGRLKNVYVRVSSPLAFRNGGGSVVVARQGCAFLPRVVSASVGQAIDLGADAAGLQVFSGPELVFSGGPSATRWTVPREGIFRLQSPGRGAGAGYVGAAPHPFGAVTGSDGKFQLSNVPPGHHILTAWHELGGERTADVMVVAGRTAEVRFSYEGERPLLTAAAPPAVTPLVAEPRSAPAPAAEPAPAPPAEPNDGRCHVATAGSIIGQACQAGGVAQARAVMKRVVMLARGRGARVECESCHADDTTFALLPVGRERLVQLLGFVSTPLVAIDPRTLAPPPRKRHAR